MTSEIEGTMTALEIDKELSYLRGLPFYKLSKALKTFSKADLTQFCYSLSLPIRFDSGELKTRDVLEAAVYERLRERV